MHQGGEIYGFYCSPIAYFQGPQSKFLHSLLTCHDKALGEGEVASIILPDFEGNEARALFEVKHQRVTYSRMSL